MTSTWWVAACDAPAQSRTAIAAVERRIERTGPSRGSRGRCRFIPEYGKKERGFIVALRTVPRDRQRPSERIEVAVGFRELRLQAPGIVGEAPVGLGFRRPGRHRDRFAGFVDRDEHHDAARRAGTALGADVD